MKYLYIRNVQNAEAGLNLSFNLTENHPQTLSGFILIQCDLIF